VYIIINNVKNIIIFSSVHCLHRFTIFVNYFNFFGGEEFFQILFVTVDRNMPRMTVCRSLPCDVRVGHQPSIVIAQPTVIHHMKYEQLPVSLAFC